MPANTVYHCMTFGTIEWEKMKKMEKEKKNYNYNDVVSHLWIQY